MAIILLWHADDDGGARQILTYARVTLSTEDLNR
jgi:hypothetical protein